MADTQPVPRKPGKARVDAKSTRGAKSPRQAVAVSSRSKSSKTDKGLSLAQWSLIGVLLAFTILCMAAVGKQGQRKGQSFWYGFVGSLFISPVLTSLYIAFLRPTNQMEDLERYQHGTWWWRIMLVVIYLLPFFYIFGFLLVFFFFIYSAGSPDLHKFLKFVGWPFRKVS